ncbi:Transcriptional activator spt7 [Coemansia sp. RSA 1646]|nr:Transcriptional activator spt7 [Coemansia sp. RSA 1646]
MISVLSGSDIDMAMWSRDGSIALGAGSPVSGADVQATKPAQDTSSSSDTAAAESAITCVLAAFHVRSAIFEQYVSVLYGTNNCSKCTNTSAVLGDLANAESQLSGNCIKESGSNCTATAMPTSGDPEVADASQATLQNKVDAPKPLVSRGLDEDEDYDDEDDSDDENKNVGEERDGGDSNTAKNLPKDQISRIDSISLEAGEETPSIDKQISGSLEQVTTQLEQGLGISIPDPSDGIKVALRGIFHTLDELDDVVYEHQVHELNVRQIEEVMEQRAAEPKDMLINKIGSLQNMKNLAQFIDNNRDSVNMTTRELSHLLSEVRPKRTKWANDRRIGQVELYDALEHVLHELKSIGEAAIPFLSQVKRKDAPDYYKVIKHPMDLGAMAKNLRNEVYNHKKQFWEHLQLIRDNCYAYNTDPGNYYRKSADALLSKARQLMESVPDILVREKGSTADDAPTEYGDESGNESMSARTNYGNREGSTVPEESTPAPGSMDYTLSSVHRGTADDTSALDCAVGINSAQFEESDHLRSQKSISVLAQNIIRATDGSTSMQSPISELTEGCERPLYEKIWRSRTSQRLAEYSQQMDDNAENEFADRRVSQRTATKMQEFLESTHNTIESVDGQDLRIIERQTDISELCTVYSLIPGSSDAADIRRRNEELDNERKEWVRSVEELQRHRWRFVSECEPTAGLPRLESLESQLKKGGVLRWLDDDCEKTVDQVLGDTGCSAQQLEKDERPTIEAYSVGRFPDNAMWREMADSIERLKSVRGIDNKIWSAKLNIPIGYLRSGATSSTNGKSQGPQNEDDADIPTIRDIHGDYVRRPDPQVPFGMDSTGAYKLLQRTVAFMLLHLGFEAVTAPAMAALVDFFGDYMTNLGRTLRTYIDKHGRTMSTEAILAHSLYSNGVEELGELEYYIRGEVGRYGNKIADMERNLTRSYQDIVSDGRPGTATLDPTALEGSDAFVTGMVSGLGDLGEDFFGFKELGLDKELGLEQLNIPQQLWYGKSVVQGDTATEISQDQQKGNLLSGEWMPIAGTEGHIGLLHPFICEKLMAANGVSPPEVEEKADGQDGDDTSVAMNGEAAKNGVLAKLFANMPEDRLPIPEDEDLPVKSRFGASRAKAPPPNYLTHPRTHMHVGSGKSVAPSGGNRSSKKKPAKSTAASKTTGGIKSTKKKTAAAAS